MGSELFFIRRLGAEKIILTPFLLFIATFCYAGPVAESSNFILSIDSYLRQDITVFKNVVDLNTLRDGDDDDTLYYGIDYSVGFDLNFKDSGPEFFLKLERNGPYDYGAPLFIHNTLINSGGQIQKYRNEQLLPQVEEFWLDTSLFNHLKFKLGLYTYAVGNGFSLNGGYENYGFTLSGGKEDFCWRLYYCRPDAVYKNRLGPRISQEEEQGIIYDHTVANFFATDIKFKKGHNSFHPYIGVLTDYTSSAKRTNFFATPTNKDILGTFGLAYNLEYDNLSFALEMAHNFGKAKSIDPAYKDVLHTGYLIYAGLDSRFKKITPSLQFLVCSGNRVTLDNALNLDAVLSNGKNRAFSYYSPLNDNLLDSISSSNVDMLPVVAMGGGYGLNYGIRRPGTFAAGDFDNLIMPSWGFDFSASEKLKIGVYEYYLRAFEKGVGTLNGEPKFLSRDLGFETDIFIDYQLNKNVLISILGGYFLPGKYYKELRDDTEGSLFSPFVRGDPDADPAYQIELAIETKF